MSAPSRRTFVNAAVILGVGLFALGGVSSIPPLRKAEREAVKKLALSFDPAESAFGGEGSQDKPWRRWKAKPAVVPEAPRFLTVDDDPEGWFSTSPPSPVDFAILFSRLKGAGHTKIGSAYLMAWEQNDPLALVALRKQLDRFDSAVLGLPLARGASAEPVPAPFLRLSLDIGEAEGDVSALPQVNRLAVPNAELGGERSQAGFTLLENETDAGDGRQHLLARWGNRIIFSLPLATEIASLGIDPEEIRVISGAEIRLGAGGPVIPIDEFGRTLPAAEISAVDIPATKIISDENPVPPSVDPLILRDARTEIPERERAWSNALGGLVQALRSAPRYENSTVLPRPEPVTELALISLLAFFGAWATALRGVFWRPIVTVMVAAFGAELVWLLAGQWNLWLPPFAVLAPAAVTLLLGFIPERKAAVIPAVTVPSPAPQAPEQVHASPVPMVPEPVSVPRIDPPEAGPVRVRLRVTASGLEVAKPEVEILPEPVPEEPVASSPPVPSSDSPAPSAPAQKAMKKPGRASSKKKRR
ncbi:hypothetical protein [Luteolibacter luteus]|uniref:CHASE2 domain-containing protein n=1 Tax=Luteolibacter luteus TaxID=2728835 RepID=A0A858RJC5_9BACT|nr:hypothetical protein [Luteolibacter luteus]QJE97017.1 hypothetical protein HHL09_14890 [Luteolibacter luteus]